MKQKGTVLEINEYKAWVAVPRPSACGDHCASCAGGCKVRGHEAWVENSIGARPGDLVTIETSDSSVLLAAFLVYGIPLLCFFLAYAISFSLTENVASATVLSLLALALSFLLLRLLDKQFAPTPTITGILHTDPLGKDESHGI